MIADLPFTLAALRQAYASGLSPVQVIEEAFRRLDATNDPGIFIHAAREAALKAAAALGEYDGRPLWGIPFVAKDNIDVLGMPTTAACPDFKYDATRDAFVVEKLCAAGAICLGKANLDQFATGLVGVRSPYPIPKNAIDPDIVPGGSSSGSAVAVAHGIATFSLGTDTAGSGRVPAALNSIVGLKPTLGAFSASGVVPACRTLDTISVFALNVSDAWDVFSVAAQFDPRDAYSRKFPPSSALRKIIRTRVAVPNDKTLETFGDDVQRAHFHADVEKLAHLGCEIIEIDFTPFYNVAKMLYEGAWVAERVAAVGDRLLDAAETIHPTTRAILEPGLKLSAADAFNGIYRLKDLARECEFALAGIDAICVPTIPHFVSVDDITKDPIGPNSRLGTYTNFVNLLDMCGIAVPTGARSDGRPGSLTILARMGQDALVASLAASLESGAVGATGWHRDTVALAEDIVGEDEIGMVVCGAHMSGLPLNPELTGRGARLLRKTKTSAKYRFYALAGGPPKRPGMVAADEGGAAIEVEVWALPKSVVGGFLAGIPSPLCLGSVELEDGSLEKGFLCESAGLAGATEITNLGSWRSYITKMAG
ncbi:MAG: allophanate hydrolase [Thalassospira sp.]|uniref:allophanate hydrolase n=1 Tax=Thalassospira sp. TaxID=1912094 RepID=UPI003A8B57BA